MDILKYLKSFLIESYWLDANVPEQARAIFTTWCMMNNIDADTKACDDALAELYKSACIEDVDVSYDNFCNYMIALIV